MNDLLNGEIIYRSKHYKTKEIKTIVSSIRNLLDELPLDDGEYCAIAMPRCDYIFFTLYALYESHIPFLIIDTTLPMERIGYMLETCEIINILTVSFAKRILDDYSTHNVDEIIPQANCQASHRIRHTDIAYALFTSGTTGFPKGVCVLREGLDNFISSIPRYIPLKPGSTMCSFTNISFDIFLLEVFVFMKVGGIIYIPSEEECINPKKMLSIISNPKIQVTQMTPSRLRMLQSVNKTLNMLDTLKILLVGGEPFPSDMLHTLQDYTNSRIYNMYGPTETTIWSTIADLTSSSNVYIGRPIDNTRIYLLDDNLNEVMPGKIGEICIAGQGLAKGYIKNTKKTNEAFLQMNSAHMERIYRTGDLGQYVNGFLYCLGRNDQQIKLFGHRIELEEIDSVIIASNLVDSVCNCYDKTKEKIICFYKSSQVVDAHKFNDCLCEKIPDYMIPANYIHVDSFLYTSSGKIDRNLMLENYYKEDVDIPVFFNGLEGDINVSSQDKIINIIEGNLNQKQNIHIKMSELHIPSIVFIKIITEIEDELNVEFDMDMLEIHNYDTLNDFIDYSLKLLKN